MNAGSLPTNSYPRYHTLTVGDILDALKDVPRDAIVKCHQGGYLQAEEWRPWAKVRIENRGANQSPIAHTEWV